MALVINKFNPNCKNQLENRQAFQKIGLNFGRIKTEIDNLIAGLADLPEYEAGEDLSGHRIVMTDAAGKIWYASSASITDSASVIGMTTGAILTGAEGPVQSFGDISEATWSWTPKAPLFLSSNGFMTETPPSSGFVLRVAKAITATRIFIDIDNPIERS